MRVAIVLLMLRAVATAQTGAQFDAASVRLDNGPLIPGVSGVIKGGPGSKDLGRFSYTQQLLKVIVMYAYDLPANRIQGPAWLDDYEDHFTIMATLSKTATRAELKEMVQALLRDRFHLAAHHETRLFPGYELTVGSHGPKMKQWAGDPHAEWRIAPPPDHGFPQLPPTVIGGISAPPSPEDHVIRATYRQTMGDFAKALGRAIGSVTGTSEGAFAPEVVDKTGLQGIYEFRLAYDGSALSGAAATDGPSTPSGAPSLFTAIENQLGLRLLKSEAIPVDVLIIDHIDKRPTEN